MNSTKLLKNKKRMFQLFKMLNKTQPDFNQYELSTIIDKFEDLFSEKITKKDFFKILFIFKKRDYFNLNYYLEYDELNNILYFERIVKEKNSIDLEKIKEKLTTLQNI